MPNRTEPVHRPSVLNWFWTKKRFSGGIAGGLSGLAKLRFRIPQGFRTVDAIQLALHQALAHLPYPCLAHRFW